MKNNLVKLLLVSCLSGLICSPALAADAVQSPQNGNAVNDQLMQLRESRARLMEAQKRQQLEAVAKRKPASPTRVEENKKNATEMAIARRESEQKERALFAEQEKARLEIQARAVQVERDSQSAMAEQLAKLAREEKLVMERASKPPTVNAVQVKDAPRVDVDSACMDDPDPNCAAKNKVLREQRAKKAK